MIKFNLMVTCRRYMEFNALRELESIFFLLGDHDAIFRRSGIGGIILGKLGIDQHKAVKEIKRLISERPWDFRFTKRYIPIDIVVKTDLEYIKEASINLSNKIPFGGSYRITVEKRFTPIHKRDVIDAIAPIINRKVSLRKPDHILLIEIVGEYTGLSIVEPDEIVRVEKEI